MIVHALILAGGRGSRLGDVRKAELRIGGRSLLSRVTDRLPDMPILVSTGPGSARATARGTGLADLAPSHDGPMAGIAAALHHLRNPAGTDDLLLSVAVDTPFLPADYAQRMVSAVKGGANAAYAAWGDQIYPTNAIYRLSALSSPGPASMPDSPKRLLKSLDARPVDWSALASADPFANLNTLTDLITLARRALSAGE